MSLLAKETVVPALGIAGLLALGYKAYKEWHLSRTSHPKPTTQHLIREIEDRFFQGLSYRLEASEQQTNRLKNNISRFVQRKDLEKVKDVNDLLCLLRDIGYLCPRNYKSHATNVLTSADLNCDSHVVRNLDLLEKVVEDLLEEDAEQQEHENDFQYDIVIAHALQDRELAVNFCQSIACNLQVPKLKIAMLDEIESEQLKQRSLQNIFKISIYVFLVASEKFTDEEMNRCLGDCMVLQNHDARWRLVPLWVKKDPKVYEKCPLDISVMKGINYWRHLQNPSDQAEQRICLNAICKTVLHGREMLKVE